MKTLIHLALITCLIATSYSQESASAPSALAKLPIGGISAESVQPMAPPALTQTFAKFSKAVSGNAKWWQDYRQKHASSKAGIPHHANMGLSAEEYASLRELSKDGWMWMPTGSQEAALVVDPGGKLRLIAEGPLSTWNALTFEPKANGVSHGSKEFKAEGTLDLSNEVGPFAGFRIHSWTHSDVTPGSSSGTIFAVRMMESDRDKHLYFHLQKMTVAAGGILSTDASLFRIPVRGTE